MRCTADKGMSLLEILVVISIMGIVTVVAIPNLSSTDEKKLDVVANEVAQAIRFTRSEAIRTGKPHGISATVNAQRLRVYELKEVFGFPAPDYSVRNPVDKKLYDLQFANEPGWRGVSLTNIYFKFVGIATPQDDIGFDPTGLPKHESAGSISMLEQATLTLGYAGHQRTVIVAPITGRVTIQ